jgi:hypothetical protein
MNAIKQWLYNWLKWFDEGGNIATGGAPNETISERAAKARNAGRKWGCVLCWLLDRVQKGHCDNALTAKIGEGAIVPDGE